MNGTPEPQTCEDVLLANPIILTEKRKFIVYKITNIINGRVYIGQTARSLAYRKREHIRDALNRNWQFALHHAIRKYGINNFIFETIFNCLSKKDMNQKEIESVEFFKSKKPTGYNMTNGGEGNQGIKQSEEWVRKRIESTRKGKGFGHIQSLEERRKKGESLKKVIHTKEWNKKVSESKLGDKNPTKRIEVREKISKAMKGKPTWWMIRGLKNPSKGNINRTKKEKI